LVDYVTFSSCSIGNRTENHDYHAIAVSADHHLKEFPTVFRPDPSNPSGAVWAADESDPDASFPPSKVGTSFLRDFVEGHCPSTPNPAPEVALDLPVRPVQDNMAQALMASDPGSLPSPLAASRA
jgi:hypothetical protein